MYILLIICLLVSTALQIILFVAAVTFLFVVIDIHCSVVIFWKVRREEEQQHQQEREPVCDGGGETECAPEDASSILPFSRPNNGLCYNYNNYGGLSFQDKGLVEGTRMSTEQPCTSSSSAVELPSTERSTNCSEVIGTRDDDDGGTLCVCQQERSPPIERDGKIKKDAGMEGSTFREMFPLGACIVVLTIYLITRRKWYFPCSLPPDPQNVVPSVVQNAEPEKALEEPKHSIKKAPPDGKCKQGHGGGGRKGSMSSSSSGGGGSSKPMKSSSVLDRFSSVLNKAQSQPPPRPAPLRIPNSQRNVTATTSQSPKISEQNALNKLPHMASTPAPETPPVTVKEDADVIEKVVEREVEEAGKENEIVHEEEPTDVEVDGPRREAPVIQLLDVLKGDTTSRALRITSGVVISTRYRIEKEIGRGGFSKVYLGTDLKWGRKVAIKTASRLLNQTKSLKRELAIYENLQSSSSKLSIPYLLHYTEIDIKRMAILVMELLGPSLEDLFEACQFQFTLGTVTTVMEQLLDVLKSLHGKTYIHRDIKPENILVGRLGTPDASNIYLIDFGTVGNWKSTVTGKHVRLEYGHARLGTNSYMSMNGHRGKTQSRKDDLEALGYSMIRFLKVNFPWSRYDDMADGIKGVITSKMKSDMNFAEEFPLDKYPKEIPDYLQYVRELAFDAEPEYDMLKEKFRSLKERMMGEGWQGLEWTKPEFLEKFPQWIVPD